MSIYCRSVKTDALEELPLFSGLRRRHLDLIARHADQVKLDAGAVLARRGRLAREFAIVVDGSARAVRDGGSAAYLGAGDFFGHRSLMDTKPQATTVIAETPITAMVIEARSFDYLVLAIPELERRLLAATRGEAPHHTSASATSRICIGRFCISRS